MQHRPAPRQSSGDLPESSARIHVALITVQVLFALWPVAGASLLRYMTPAALVGIRLALGAPILALAARLHREKLPSASDLLRLAGLGALGISVNQLLFVGGLSRSGPVNASIAVLLIPPFTVGAALLLRQERFAWFRALGVGIAMLGGAMLVGAERFDGSRLVGNLMLVGNTASYGVYLVLARKTVAKLGALRTVAWVMVLGGLEALPFTVVPTLAVDWSALPLTAWGAVAFVVLGPTVLTYLLNAWALSRADSSLVATYVYAQPPIAALASWWLLDILPSSRVVLAGAIIVVGLALATRK